MYHYEQDKDFLSKLRTLCGEIIQECCHYLKEDEDIGANFYLVLSGAGILIAQNENEPIELGYNLEITRCEYPDNCYRIRNAMIRVFNKVLKKYGWAECQDTTYTLKTEKGAYLDGYDTEFYINLCVTTSDRYNTLYLLTRKTGKNGKSGRYFWERIPNSAEIQGKVTYIKNKIKWKLVRYEYMNALNASLEKDKEDKPAVLSYIEVVNKVYNTRKSWEEPEEPSDEPDDSDDFDDSDDAPQEEA